MNSIHIYILCYNILQHFSTQCELVITMLCTVERKPASFAPSQPSNRQVSGAGAEIHKSHDAGEEEGAHELEDEQNILKAPGSDAFVWKPPQDQTGDGRTSLNDKLGY